MLLLLLLLLLPCGVKYFRVKNKKKQKLEWLDVLVLHRHQRNYRTETGAIIIILI